MTVTHGVDTPLEAHKHTTGAGAAHCVVVRVAEGVLRTYLDGRELYALDVAHGPIALRFAKQTMDRAYPGGVWQPGPCPEHPAGR